MNAKNPLNNPLMVTINPRLNKYKATKPVYFEEIYTKELDIKGTWKRNHDPNHSVFAAICCPSCGNSFGISRLNHRITKEGVISPLYQCPFVLTKKCNFEKTIHLKNWMPLFAIACERYRPTAPNKFLPEIFYTHAESAKQASMEFYNSKGPYDKLVGVSVVIGYNVEDKKGKVLSV